MYPPRDRTTQAKSPEDGVAIQSDGLWVEVNGSGGEEVKHVDEPDNLGTNPETGAVGATGASEQQATSGGAADQAKEVAGTAADRTREVAKETREQATRVGREAADQARNLVGQATTQLRDQGQRGTTKASENLRSLGDQMRALSEGRSEEAGQVRDYAQNVAERLSGFASSLEQRGFDGLIEDVRDFARRRPVVFLGTAALAGFALGRLVRSQGDGGEGEQATEAYPSLREPYAQSGTLPTPAVPTAPLAQEAYPSAPPPPIDATVAPGGQVLEDTLAPDDTVVQPDVADRMDLVTEEPRGGEGATETEERL